jgi:hypothetical protein
MRKQILASRQKKKGADLLVRSIPTTKEDVSVGVAGPASEQIAPAPVAPLPPTVKVEPSSSRSAITTSQKPFRKPMNVAVAAPVAKPVEETKKEERYYRCAFHLRSIARMPPRTMNKHTQCAVLQTLQQEAQDV